MTLTRQRFANLFELASEVGPYAFWPVIPAGLDPQFHVSRNDRAQPFHLVHEHDAVLVHLSGRGEVRFPDGPVRWHELVPGDHVYLPAGLPYRVVCDEPCVQVLMKAEEIALEGVAFYCDRCDHLLERIDFDAASQPLQRSYHRICESFNQNEDRRRCADCGTIHPTIDLDLFGWLSIADQIEACATATAPA